MYESGRRMSGGRLQFLRVVAVAAVIALGFILGMTSASATEPETSPPSAEPVLDAVLLVAPQLPDGPGSALATLTEPSTLVAGDAAEDDAAEDAAEDNGSGDDIRDAEAAIEPAVVPASAPASAPTLDAPSATAASAGSDVGSGAESVPAAAEVVVPNGAADPTAVTAEVTPGANDSSADAEPVVAMTGAASVELGPLTISGASTIQPIMGELVNHYRDLAGAELRISGGGSGRGISDVREGRSDIGMVSRSLRDAEKADLNYTTIGLDTLVFIVNSANPQTQITRDQLAALYTRSQDWQQLNGFPWPVRLVSKEPGRSTLDLFEEFSGLTSPDRSNASPPLISRQATVIGSNLEALTLVGGTRGAIGYVSLGTAVGLRDQGLLIRILALGGVVPSAATIQSGQYPIRRELNLVYRERTPAIDALLGIMQSAEGQSIIEQAGFIPTGGR